MANNLNSVLIEGSVAADPVYLSTLEKRTSVSTFKLESVRWYRESGNSYNKEVTQILVEAWGSLAETVYNKAKKDTGVRIVGRLRSVDGEIRLAAEHAEFRKDYVKPDPPKTEKIDVHGELVLSE